MPAHLDTENAEAGLWAMESHPFDQAGEGFSVMIFVSGIFLEAHCVRMLEAERES